MAASLLSEVTAESQSHPLPLELTTAMEDKLSSLKTLILTTTRHISTLKVEHQLRLSTANKISRKMLLLSSNSRLSPNLLTSSKISQTDLVVQSLEPTRVLATKTRKTF
jgi:hypothetical protein